MSVLEDHRRAAAAFAIEMKPVTADVNQPSRRMVKLAVTLDGATFVKKAAQCKGGEQEDLSSQEIAQDPQSAASCLVVPADLKMTKATARANGRANAATVV